MPPQVFFLSTKKVGFTHSFLLWNKGLLILPYLCDQSAVAAVILITTI